MKQILLLLAVSSCFFLAAVPVSAKNLFNDKVCTGTTSSSAVCIDNANTDKGNDPLSGPNGLLIKITNIIAFIAGAAAIIMIIVSALRFITSGSDLSTSSRTDTDVEGARHTITNAVIGLIIIVLARTIMVFVINRI